MSKANVIIANRWWRWGLALVCLQMVSHKKCKLLDGPFPPFNDESLRYLWDERKNYEKSLSACLLSYVAVERTSTVSSGVSSMYNTTQQRSCRSQSFCFAAIAIGKARKSLQNAGGRPITENDGEGFFFNWATTGMRIGLLRSVLPSTATKRFLIEAFIC